MARGLNKKYKPQNSQTLRSTEDLVQAGLVSSSHAENLQELAQRYTIAITPAMTALIDPEDVNDPIAAQFVPDMREMNLLPQELLDPTGDYVHAPLKVLVHRHKDRVLLKPTAACAVYCRFCFRREMVGPNGDTITQTDIDEALAYIAAHDEIKEVILTGGDPLMLAPQRLAALVQRLQAMPHIKWLRFHTRVPVVAPEKINAEMLNALRGVKALVMAVHVNHPREITTSSSAALARLAHQGVTLLGQSVLLKGVNDSADTLSELFETLMMHRVKPYYLHHPDLTTGTSHFRMDFETGMRLMAEVRARISGVCVPHYVVDIPGGVFKVQVTTENVRSDPEQAGGYLIRAPNGTEHKYWGSVKQA